MKKILLTLLISMASLSAYSQVYIGTTITNSMSLKEQPHRGLYQFNVGYSMQLKNLSIDCSPLQLTANISNKATKYNAGWTIALRYYLGKYKNIK